MTDGRRVLVVTGLRSEARIAAGPRSLAVAGGGSSSTLRARLAGVDREDFAAVLSFGLAGALDPALRVGDLILAQIVANESANALPSPLRGGVWCGGGAEGTAGSSCTTPIPVALRATRPSPQGGVTGAAALSRLCESSPVERVLDGPLATRWRRALDDAGQGYREVVLAGVDAPVLAPNGRAELRRRTGADAVDMESHVAAAFAARHALPFAALRVISDPADRALPQAAGVAMRPDGSIDLTAVLLSLARDPRQIPALIRTGRDAAIAFRALRRVRGLLGPGFGFDL